MSAPTPIYQWLYQTPPEFDNLLLESDGHFLIGAHFSAATDLADAAHLAIPPQPLVRAILWLDCYFAGHLPGPLPPYRLPGVTPFRQAVSDQLCQIPWGQTTTYGALAVHSRRLSPRAVGNAVGWNASVATAAASLTNSHCSPTKAPSASTRRSPQDEPPNLTKSRPCS